MNTEDLIKFDFADRNNWDYERFAVYNQQDKLCLGTVHYQGLAYFWAHKYRHVMRDADPKLKIVIHHKFLVAGLNLGDETPKHDRIINAAFPGENYTAD